MIRTIVVDDEWYNLEEICDMVEKTGFMTVRSRCQNGADALREAARVLPQAAFIDIEMPEMDGLTLAEKLLEAYPEMKIVFITGWNQYAVAAFELNALDYIMKPLNKARFQKMAERLKSQFKTNETEEESALTIRCFGGFEAVMNGRPVIWKRLKAEELFAYLLLHQGIFVNKDIILENLWPDYEYTKSLPILQTSVCKIRNIFSDFRDEVKLIYADNKYGLFLSGVQCDYLDTEDALARFQGNMPETYNAVESACEIFQKGLFASCGYLWSEGLQENLRQRLTSALRIIARAYRIQPDNTCGLETLKQLSRLLPEDEDAQLLYLNTLRVFGKKEQIAQHGKWLCETLKADYGAELPEAIDEIIKEQI
ncbi:MAG TPA: response regulator [Clostridia bacterium]|nr:response regulator [Clostridia bacterium]